MASAKSTRSRTFRERRSESQTPMREFRLTGSVVGQLHEAGGEWFGFDELKQSIWQRGGRTQVGTNTDVRHHVDSSAGEGFRARRSPLPEAIPSQTVSEGCGRPREVLPEMRSPSCTFVLLQSWR